NTTFSLSKIGENFKTKYLDRYLKLYSDTIRVKKRNPTFFSLFALADRVSATFNDGGKYEPGHVFHDDSKIKRFMTYGDSQFDDDPSIAATMDMEKRSEVPLLPLCLPGNAEL